MPSITPGLKIVDAPFSFNRSVRIGSRRDRITGDSGALTGRELLRRSGVVRLLAKRLPDKRDGRRIRHSQRRLARTLLLLSGQGRREHSEATALRLARWGWKTMQELDLLINARVDAFLSDEFGRAEERIEETVTRAEIYGKAGADCVYPIGPGDAETLTVLRSRITLPLNALASSDAVPLERMAAIGINRVSFGPFIFRSCLRKFADIADALSRSAGYECFGRELMTGSEASLYLTSESEQEHR